MHWSLTVYGGHCLSVRLPSKVTRSFTHRVRLPALRNNVPQHFAIFPDAIIHCSCLMVFTCVLQWGIDGVGFGASSNFFPRARWTALAYHSQHKKSTCWTTT